VVLGIGLRGHRKWLVVTGVMSLLMRGERSSRGHAGVASAANGTLLALDIVAATVALGTILADDDRRLRTSAAAAFVLFASASFLRGWTEHSRTVHASAHVLTAVSLAVCM
jgi:hypothetical protein